MIDEDDGNAIFIFDDPDYASETKLKDLEIGDSFIFMGKRFRKVNNMGYALGVSNIEDPGGHRSHLHPNTKVSLLQ